MAETQLDIILKVIDNASAEFKKVNAEAIKSVEELKDSHKNLSGATKETSATTSVLGSKIEETSHKSKTFGQELKTQTQSLKDFHKASLLIVAALATVIRTASDAAKYNEESRKSYEQFTRTISSFSAVVGQTLQPALEGVTKIAGFLRDTLEASVAGFIKIGAFTSEFFTNLGKGPVEAYQRAISVANDATDQFLNKIEQTRAKAESGITLESEAKQIQNLKTITITGTRDMKKHWEDLFATIENFGSALQQAEVLGKGFAKAAAGVAIGMAIINTAKGITAALAGPPEGPPWPINLAMASLVAATGAIQIATIAAQSFAVGTPNVPSDMMAQVHEGEAIIPATFADAIRRGDLSLSGGGGGSHGDINIVINYPKFNNQEEVKSIMGQIGFEIDRQLRYAS